MRIIISAGGTGGHIYPALAIINKFKQKEKNLEVLYIGTHNRMEKDIIPNENIKYVAIEIYGFTKNIVNDIKCLFLLNKAYKKCINIMKEFKPDVVIGVGGYVTYPVIKAASKLGIKTFIHEQNAIPGKSNKVLSKYADVIGVSFEESIKYFKHNNIVMTGNPVGENAIDIKSASKDEFGLNKTKKLVLIVSGSLGSSSLNPKLKEFLSSISKENYEVLLVTGKNYFDYFNNTKYSSNVHLEPYINNLTRVMKMSDVMITRAGASTTIEIMSLNIPSIFIPSPNVANNHQYYNALALKNNNAGLLIEEKDVNSNILKENINILLNDKSKYLEMKNNLKRLSINDSSTRIYNIIKDLIK